MEPRLISHYQIEGRIGSGGMGVVLKARDLRLDRIVALKVLPAPTGDDPDAKTRLIREARAASALDHHNIGTIYDIEDTDDGQLVLAMAYYEGRTLAELIGLGPLSVEDAVGYATQVADGLSEAHQAGIIHCDIKPQNLLVTPRGVIKILDFGIARMLRQTVATTGAAAITGTLPYMSPEQVCGRPLDARTDVWSLGVVTYEMLTGQRPFDGDPAAIVAAIVSQEPRALLASRRDVPGDLERVVTEALSKSVENRMRSASEFAARLRAPHPAGAPAPRQPTRIIVLPFHLLRADPDIDFLSFSLSDAITASLIGLESLQVRSSAVASRFQGAGLDLAAVRRETDVDLVLRGTLVRAGSKVRVQAELTEPATGTALWSQTSDVHLGDLFALQDELTNRIVTGLAAPLTAHDQRHLGRDVPLSAAAFEEYLRANQLAQQVADWPAAIALYQQCLRRDSRYAPAWARLGRVYWLTAKYVALESSENLARARAAFETALSLNADLALAHHLFTPLQVDMGQAREAMVRLLTLAGSGGNDAEVFAGLVHACRYCGLLNASLRADARARDIDPRIQTSIVQTRFQRGEYALVALQDIREFPIVVSTALMVEGRSVEAADQLRPVEASNHRLRDFAIAVRALAEGRMEASRSAIERTLADGFRGPEELYHLSRLLARLGAVDRSLEVLNRAIDGGFYSIGTLQRDPWLAPLRSSERFTAAYESAAARHGAAVAAFNAAGGAALLGDSQ